MLLIEDDLLMVRMYQRKFAKDGYDVQVGLDGTEGLEQIKGGFEPDIVLLDIMMPRMNGFEFMEAVKKEPKWKNQPIILLTNLSDTEENIQQGLKLGARGYIVKSETPVEEVVRIVEQNIGNPLPE